MMTFCNQLGDCNKIMKKNLIGLGWLDKVCYCDLYKLSVKKFLCQPFVEIGTAMMI